MQKRLLQAKQAVPTILFLVFTVFLYGPLSVYLPNSEEMLFSISDVLKVVLPVSMGVLLVIVAFFLLSSEQLFKPLLLLLFGISLALYIQGNYIGSDYGTGVLDGTEIDWTQYRSYGILNSILWFGCIVLPFLVWFVLRKKDIKVEKVVAIASLFLLVIQIPAMAVQALSYRGREEGISISSEDMFSVSGDDDIFVFVVDTLDEVYYSTYLEAHPEFVDELEGFTHYGNTLSGGAKTMLAMPAILSGKPFTRQTTYGEYLVDVWNDTNVTTVLSDSGYDVRIFSEPLYFAKGAEKSVANFTLSANRVGSYWTLGKKLYKVTAFKFLPHVLKRFVWFDTAEFAEAMQTEDMYVMDDMAFYEQFLSERFSTGATSANAFRLYHWNGAHSPYRMGSDGKRSSDATVETQVEGVFTIVKQMLDDMKEKGIYDTSTIVITADHGIFNKAEQPFLLIKEKGATGPCVENNAPVSLFDLPVFLTEIVGKELPNQTYGRRISELQEGEVRERHMFLNASGSSRVTVDEYVTTSYAGDYDNLILVHSYEDPLGADAPYALGEVLSFEADATGNRYCIEGFGTNTGFRTMLRGPISTLTMPLAEKPKKDLEVSIALHPLSVKDLNLSIDANGDTVFQGVVTKEVIDSGLQFKVPASVITDENNTLQLDFLFNESSSEEMSLDASARTITISFVSLVIE